MWFNIVFTVEFGARVLLATRPLVLLTDPFMYIDFFAIVPFYLILVSGKHRWLNILKALRMIRLLKLARQYSGSLVLVKALRISIDALLVPLFFLVILVSVMGSVIFYAEDLEVGEDSAFESVPVAMWFMLVTITTVGYGDLYPHSVTGRWISSFTMVLGIIFLAMPLAIIGSNFVDVYQEKEKVQFIEQVKNKLMKCDIDSIYKNFREIDVDGTGTITFNEFKAFLDLNKGLDFDSRATHKLWLSIDTDDSGFISFDEFLDLFGEILNIDSFQIKQKSQEYYPTERRSSTARIDSFETNRKAQECIPPDLPDTGMLPRSSGSRVNAIEDKLQEMQSTQDLILKQLQELQMSLSKS